MIEYEQLIQASNAASSKVEQKGIYAEPSYGAILAHYQSHPQQDCTLLHNEALSIIRYKDFPLLHYVLGCDPNAIDCLWSRAIVFTNKSLI